MRSRPRVPLIALALSTIALGCGEDSTPPTSPEPEATVALATGLAWRQVDGRSGHTCAVTTDDRAYCWGDNSDGQLGNGTTVSSAAPSLVAGNLRFRHVSVGSRHSCGITTGDRAYCWGFNWYGQVGDGTGYPENIRRLSPVPVSADRRFRQVRAGDDFTCALTPWDGAFCWGSNVFGQLGDGTRTTRHAPVRVRGQHQWRQLDGGDTHICGVTTDDQGYCWGMNFWGQLGDGTQNVPSVPVAVTGGLEFRQISAGRSHSCGVTTDNRAFCWGHAESGELGDGSSYPPVLSKRAPVAVATARRFQHVWAGEEHTCGLTLAGRGFCWGANRDGQVGNGTAERQLTPVRVSGDLIFKQVGTGWRRSFALTPEGVMYAWGLGVLTPAVRP
ncbi:MAG TPA: hypothetical protein VFT84_09515 [Gemmatimonadales bacterium]|nr:hypothetical protein [Gemmatimonadales bacterium]